MALLGEIDRNKTKPRKMDMYLAKPNRTIIGKLKHTYNVELSTRLNQIYELTFDVPYEVEINHEMRRHPQVDLLRDRYLIKVVIGELSEWFVIYNPTDNMTTDEDAKGIQAYLLPYQLRDKVIRELDLTTDNTTEDGEIVANAPEMMNRVLQGTTWNYGYIDSDFELTQRTFSISETTALDLIFTIGETFNALLIWNTEDKQIDLYNPTRIGQDKGLKIHFGKYLEELTNDHEMDQMCTRFKPYGKDNLTIQRVNPTGLHYIEDFSYFMYPFERDDNKNVLEHSYYMTDALCHDILDHQDKVENYRGVFEDYIATLDDLESQYDDETAIMITLEDELAELNDELRIAQARNAPYDEIKYPYDDILDDIDAKEQEIEDQQAQLDLIQSNIDDTQQDVEDLEDELDPMTVFTEETMEELLNSYIIEKTWVDENYYDDQELYDDALERFLDYRQPPQRIELSIINFLDVVEAQYDWDKLNLGDVINIEYNRFNVYVQAKIIEINYDYENSDITVTVSNVTDLTKKEDILDELYKKAVSTSTKLDMSKFKWDGYENDQSEIKGVLDNFWDWVHDEITMSVNNTVKINRKGITVLDPEDPCRFVRITNGVIGITNDCGNTYRHAITSKGIIGENIMGRIITGQNVIIGDPDGILEILGNKGVVSNRDGEEVMRFGLIENSADDGVTEDCFGIHLENDTNQVIMSDCVGFRINKYENGAWQKKFHADASGDLIVEDLTAKRITIQDSHDDLIIDTDASIFNIGRFEEIISDGTLNEMEKHDLEKELRRIKQEKINLIGAYSGTGDTIGGHVAQFNMIDREDENKELIRSFTEDYYADYTTLVNYLDPLIDDKTTVTDVDREVFNTNFENYFDSAEKLINEINNILEKSSLQLGRNYNGVVIDSISGVVVTRGDDVIRTVLNATDGIYIENMQRGEKVFYVDTAGNLHLNNDGGKFTFDSSGLLIENGDNYFSIDADNGLQFIRYFTGTQDIKSQFTMSDSGSIILSSKTKNTVDGGDTFKLTDDNGIEMKMGELLNGSVSMGMTYADGFYINNQASDGFSTMDLTQNGLALESNMVDGYNGTVQAGLTLTDGLYMSYFNDSETEGMNFSIEDGIYLYSNAVYDDGSMLETGFSIDEGFFIKKAGENRFWVDPNGTLYAKQLTVIPENGSMPHEDVNGSFVSDLTVNSLKTITADNATNFVHAEENYLNLVTNDGGSEIQKFSLTFEGTGYNSFPKMIFGSGDTGGNQTGYIIKDSEKFLIDYTNYQGNTRRLNLADSSSEAIQLETDNGELLLKATNNTISMNSSRILLTAGNSEIELGSNGTINIRGSSINFVEQ